MDVIYLLIPGMIFLGLIMVGVLVWAVKSGQYDDLEGDGQRILMDEDDPLLPKKSSDQLPPSVRKKSRLDWPDADSDN